MYQTFINVLIPRAKAHCAKLSSQMRTSRLWKSIALPNSWSLPVQLLNLVTDRNWSLSICFNSTIQFHKTDAQRICNQWSEMRYWTFKSSQSGGCLDFAWLWPPGNSIGNFGNLPGTFKIPHKCSHTTKWTINPIILQTSFSSAEISFVGRFFPGCPRSFVDRRMMCHEWMVWMWSAHETTPFIHSVSVAWILHLCFHLIRLCVHRYLEVPQEATLGPLHVMPCVAYLHILFLSLTNDLQCGRDRQLEPC